MTVTTWMVLWALLLAGSLLLWIGLARGTYRRFRNLQSEIRKLLTAINAVKTAKQTRLATSNLASSEKGH